MSSHPNREEWTAFLYEEIQPEEKQTLAAHLQECDECRQSVDCLRQTMSALDQWKIPARTSRRPALQPWLQWAAAAAILLTCGFLAGTAARPKNDVTARLAKAEAEVAAARTLLAQLTKTISEDRQHDQIAVVKALEKMDLKHATELRAMRKDLETVATLTEVGFQSAQNQIVRLAGYSAENTGAR